MRIKLEGALGPERSRVAEGPHAVLLGRFCARVVLEFQSGLGADGGWLFGLISSQAESRQGSGRHFLVGSVPVGGNRDGRGADFAV